MKNMKLTTEFKARLGACESVQDLIDAIEGAHCFGRLDCIISALVGSRVDSALVGGRVEALRDIADKLEAGAVQTR